MCARSSRSTNKSETIMEEQIFREKKIHMSSVTNTNSHRLTPGSPCSQQFCLVHLANLDQLGGIFFYFVLFLKTKTAQLSMSINRSYLKLFLNQEASTYRLQTSRTGNSWWSSTHLPTFRHFRHYFPCKHDNW